MARHIQTAHGTAVSPSRNRSEQADSNGQRAKLLRATFVISTCTVLSWLHATQSTGSDPWRAAAISDGPPGPPPLLSEPGSNPLADSTFPCSTRVARPAFAISTCTDIRRPPKRVSPVFCAICTAVKLVLPASFLAGLLVSYVTSALNARERYLRTAQHNSQF